MYVLHQTTDNRDGLVKWDGHPDNNCLIFTGHEGIKSRQTDCLELIKAQWCIYVSVIYIIIASVNSAPSHYLNQCCHIVSLTLRNIILWNFISNSEVLFKEMHLKMSSVKWRPFCLSLNVLNPTCSVMIRLMSRKPDHLVYVKISQATVWHPGLMT